MKCKKVKELILTDYLDEQLNEDQKKNIEEHLSSCGVCREYELAARKTVIEPFNNVEKQNPPEAAWHKIKEQIKEENRQGLINPFADLIRRINPFAYALKPALAVVTIIIIIFVATAIIKLPSENSEVVEVDPDNQIECMNYLLGVFDQDSLTENNDFGTSIEEYFL